MKYAVFLGILFLPALSLATEQTFTLTADLWARPRTGVSVVRMTPVASAVDAMLQTPGSVLVLRYPGGDEGSLWVQELKAWLISLGIDSQHIETLPGGAEHGRIELSVKPGSDSNP